MVAHEIVTTIYIHIIEEQFLRHDDVHADYAKEMVSNI